MNTENNPNRPRTRKVLYTVTGRYEHLASAPRFPESDWDYICLTDNPNLTSDTWTILQFEPPFENDHARNSRLPKACPHRFLQDYETSLYIDNTVALESGARQDRTGPLSPARTLTGGCFATRSDAPFWTNSIA